MVVSILLVGFGFLRQKFRPSPSSWMEPGAVVFAAFFLAGCGLACCLGCRSIVMKSYGVECFVHFSIREKRC